MTNTSRRLLFWSPRVLCIAFALFLSLFATDVFGEGRGFWNALPDFLIHLVPVYLLIAILVVAWRWEWVGAVLFAVLGLGYIVMAFGKFDILAYVFISGPLFILATLFWWNWQKHDVVREGR